MVLIGAVLACAGNPRRAPIASDCPASTVPAATQPHGKVPSEATGQSNEVTVMARAINDLSDALAPPQLEIVVTDRDRRRAWHVVRDLGLAETNAAALWVEVEALHDDGRLVIFEVSARHTERIDGAEHYAWAHFVIGVVHGRDAAALLTTDRGSLRRDTSVTDQDRPEFYVEGDALAVYRHRFRRCAAPDCTPSPRQLQPTQRVPIDAAALAADTVGRWGPSSP